jgi:thiamine biosynthesis lipoprotein ApbE
MRIVFLIALLTLAACGGHGQVELVGSTMGTQFSIKLPNGLGNHDALKLQKAIQAELDAADAAMSTYKPESTISQFNRSTSVDWQPVDLDFCHKVEQSLEMSAATEGAFDITVGPLVNLWGFGPDEMIDEPPSDDEVDWFLASTGFEHLYADCSKPAIRKDIPDLMLDMSAIGKGYAADRVAGLLTAMDGHIRRLSQFFRGGRQTVLAYDRHTHWPARHALAGVSDGCGSEGLARGCTRDGTARDGTGRRHGVRRARRHGNSDAAQDG